MKEQSEVSTVEIKLEVGKESKEVADFLGKVIKDIKSGKSVGEIASGNLQSLYTAVEGFEKLDDEAKHRSRNATGAYALYQLAEALAPVK